MSTCDEYREEIIDSLLEKTVPEELPGHVAEHIWNCPSCREFLESLRSIESQLLTFDGEIDALAQLQTPSIEYFEELVSKARKPGTGEIIAFVASALAIFSLAGLAIQAGYAAGVLAVYGMIWLLLPILLLFSLSENGGRGGLADAN